MSMWMILRIGRAPAAALGLSAAPPIVSCSGPASDKVAPSGRGRRPVLLLATGHNDQRGVGQRPLQREGFLRWGVRPEVNLLRCAQDDRHGLRMDGADFA